jgi:hypothetical protein
MIFIFHLIQAAVYSLPADFGAQLVWHITFDFLFVGNDFIHLWARGEMVCNLYSHTCASAMQPNCAIAVKMQLPLSSSPLSQC